MWFSRGKAQFGAFVNFHGKNTPVVADFEVPRQDMDHVGSLGNVN